MLPHLDISNESIKYYASLVTYYSVFRLKQLDERVVDIYLLCFVYHRYQRLHDNLINSLIHNVRRYVDRGKECGQGTGVCVPNRAQSEPAEGRTGAEALHRRQH